ncbi:MAG TPA: ankyrin repeat domain-containing protein [Fimbriimonadaceae bacterium]
MYLQLKPALYVALTCIYSLGAIQCFAQSPKAGVTSETTAPIPFISAVEFAKRGYSPISISPDGKTELCKISFDVRCSSSSTVANLLYKFELLNKQGQMIYTVPVSTATFYEKCSGFKGPLLPKIYMSVSASLSIPIDKVREGTAYWIEPISGNFLAQWDFSKPSNVFGRLIEGGEAAIDQYKKQDPKLLKTVEPESGLSVLDVAILTSDINSVRRLVSEGADVTQKTANGLQPVHFAALANAEILNYILSMGANPNALTIDNRTPLMVIAQSSLEGAQIEETVKVLFAHRANPNLFDEWGSTALMFAGEAKKPAFVKILIEGGAKVNVADPASKITALHVAAAQGDIECVRILLNYGAKVDARSALNTTPWDLATKNGRTEVAAFLVYAATARGMHYTFGPTAAK